MSIRTAALAGTAFVLALALTASPAAKRPPSPGDKQAPTTPTNLRITASSDTSISLAWNASTDNSTNWWYCVQANSASCLRVDPPQTTFTRSGLAPGRTTTWTVYAIDAAGNRSATSNAVTHTTPADTTPPTAPTLTASAVYPARVTVTWTASTDNTSGVLYTVYLNGSVLADWWPYRFANALHLTPSTTYEFRVDARDNFGNVSQSNVLSVTTPAKTEDVPPSAPTNLALGFQSSQGEAWLSWSQSADDTDSPSEILYDVYFNGVRGHPDDSAIGSGSTIAYCRGLATGPTEIVVRAVDTSGNVSASSNAVVLDC
jgi:chitodextrinase